MNIHKRIEEDIENKIGHSWNGKLYAQNDNTVEFINVSDIIDETVNQLEQLFKEEIEEVIGEDEKIDEDLEYQWDVARNDLRAEQRAKLSQLK